ncbi:conserved Plasmodium protein, unknown function [Plasmodium sp. gorilla clade G2]|uniref:conserved Plasmodium protein, unknown function n=1 Tax=Plasmodium sp. gorilla clade G2 TaxID=880535 RepID=UPI000D219FFC|nr:conserved Plasmodium protein, unknown function [Plasmodium sp. gorilla clade G2]SOV18032.1 conserved Plasmodium protein, unknown function [Plasmodium sp. gorilla clade G2]
MEGEINKLTSVETEYLEKSGKKRRQKSIIECINNYNEENVENVQNVENDRIQNILDEINASNDISSTNEVMINMTDAEMSEEDLDTLEVIRQLSSIKIDSDEESKDKIVYNKKEKKKKLKNKKKNKENKNTYVFDIYDIECVEDAIIYDESKDTEFPDLHELFSEYNGKYFFNKLSSVHVNWSNKMKLCAGICIFKKSGYCCIRLSLPLLKLRKIKEYRETLLHEMIHAFLFLTRSNTKHDGHGPEFKKHMHRINRATGLHITIYHSFHNEVNFYRNHIWRCTGVCRKYPPHFGFVKRSMNRPPGPKEKWWRRHSSYCCGNFVKIEETEENKRNEMKNMNKGMNNLIQKRNNKRDKDTFEKRQDNNNNNIFEDMVNDEIIILDKESDHRNKKQGEDEMDIINLIKNLFSNNKDKILSFPDITVDYHKAFEDKNYFEID